MRWGSALALAAALASVPARADVEVTLDLLGYSALFQECEMQIALTRATPPTARVVMDYDIEIGATAVVQCRLTATADGQLDTECGGDLDVDHQCEEIARVRLVGMSCYDADEAEIACGDVTLTGPKPDFFVFD